MTDARGPKSLQNLGPRWWKGNTMLAIHPGRHAAAICTSAGVAWVALSLLSILTPEPARFLDILFVVPYALSLGGVLGLHAVHLDHASRLERIGAWSSVIGMAVTLVGQVGIITDTDLLTRLVLPAGVVIWLLGLVLFGIAMVRARVLPAWVGIAIALSQPLAVLAGLVLSPISPLSSTGDYSGAIGHGLVWLALGSALRRLRRDAPREIGAQSDVSGGSQE